MGRDLEREKDEMIKLLEAYLPQDIRDILSQCRPIEQYPVVIVTTNEQGTCHADAQ